MADSTDRRGSDQETDDKADSNHDDTDYQAAYAAQFYEDEKEHWANSYGGDDEPPTRGGEYSSTAQTPGGTVVQKPRPKNNP
ncbi:hypothetical protein F5Y05DRAFT_396326 [Hypoxylon sp. FL0543]|nr:hypothetical protein F5Y05DRAFT_396326 [Hypoxylon sp. FL0543]